MESKHTPGPWHCVLDENNPDHQLILGAGIDIASVRPWAGGARYANAKLIAAAPEMFEALDSIGGLAYDVEVYGEDELRERMRAIRDAVKQALTKARGR